MKEKYLSSTRKSRRNFLRKSTLDIRARYCVKIRVSVRNGLLCGDDEASMTKR